MLSLEFEPFFVRLGPLSEMSDPQHKLGNCESNKLQMCGNMTREFFLYEIT